jgi:hypothetical protein
VEESGLGVIAGVVGGRRAGAPECGSARSKDGYFFQ